MKRIVAVLSIALLLLWWPPAGFAHATGHTDSRSSPPLTYHGGPIVTKAKNYLVFWTGGNKNAFDPKYLALLQQWQKDASHITVFKATTQYGQADGKHPTDTTYGGTYFNSTPFPKGAACPDGCVEAKDITRIAKATATANKIPTGSGSIVYVYTPQGVRHCYGLGEASILQCGQEKDDRDYYYSFCGNHGSIPMGQKSLYLVYVNYPGPRCYASDGSQRFPNGLASDAAVNLTASYQMEVITNPLSTAWNVNGTDETNGYDISSQCWGEFGPTLSGKMGNSHYNGHTYDVQAMGSNKDHGCVIGSQTNGF